MSAPRKNRLPIAIAIAVPIVCCGGPLLYFTQPWWPLGFDAKRWQEDHSETKTPSDARYRMRNEAIVAVNKRKGQTRSDIETFLGPPDFEFGLKGEKMTAEDAIGDQLAMNEYAIGYEMLNDPPFPQEFTAILWLKFNSKDQLLYAWEDDGLY